MSPPHLGYVLSSVNDRLTVVQVPSCDDITVDALIEESGRFATNELVLRATVSEAWCQFPEDGDVSPYSEGCWRGGRWDLAGHIH